MEKNNKNPLSLVIEARDFYEIYDFPDKNLIYNKNLIHVYNKNLIHDKISLWRILFIYVFIFSFSVLA